MKFLVGGTQTNATVIDCVLRPYEGVIAADRTLHPHAYEVRYQHRNIHTSLAGQGRVNVYNEYFFKDLSQYRMLWNISVDGEAVSSGVVENLNIAPRKTETVDLDRKSVV